MERADGKDTLATRRCGDSGYRNNQGGPCQRYPLRGLKACRRHIGIPPAKARAKSEVAQAVLAWDMNAMTLDPGEALLRLLTVTFARAHMLADLLQRAYDAAERLATAELAAAASGDDHTDDARMALAQVMATGGVAALVGRTRAGDGKGGVVETGEQIRALAALEQSERKLAADFAAKAVAAGIAERQVRLAERQADLMVAIVAGSLRELGLDPDADVVARIVEGQIMRALPG